MVDFDDILRNWSWIYGVFETEKAESNGSSRCNDRRAEAKLVVENHYYVSWTWCNIEFSVHGALEQMKKSLSYISSKLVNKESRSNLGKGT